MSISAPALPRPTALARPRSLRLPRPELLGLLVLAAVLNLWSLSRNGWANDYYAAAVRSMSTSWHDFLYNSFDPSGVMTVDKPPLALWVQALSARVFGFSSWSILVPQALMGVASVALVYDVARRRFGRAAGAIAGLTLALTPISVAISRHNNPDALLVLCCVAALWFLVRALEDGRTRWLVWSGVMIGLGFETKMAAALMVVPAFAAAYLWIAPRGRGRALRQLAAGGGAMALVGLAWPVLVWLTPAADRPWISGTSDNSVWSLIFGYNGLGRVDGQAGGPGGGIGGPGGGNGGPFGGSTGPLRLLNEALGGQAGWLLGFTIAAALALAVSTRLRRRDARSGWLIAVAGSFATIAVVFSEAKGIFHPYYVSQLAPFTALLVGAGSVQLARGGLAMRVLAGAAVVGGVWAETQVLGDTPGSLAWLPAVLIAAAVVAVVALAATDAPKVRGVVLGAMLGLLLLAPASWSAQTLGHATSGTFPAGGPANAGGGFGGPGGGAMRGGLGGPPAGGFAPPSGFGGRPGGGMFAGDSSAVKGAVAYAKAHGGGSVAVSSQSGAAGSVIASGADVVGIGGFSGRESQVSAAWLAQAVGDGKLRYVLADSGGGLPNDGRTGADDVMAVVAKTCRKITLSSGTVLYDCQGYADAIAGGVA